MELVASRVYFNELITQIILKVDWSLTQEVNLIRVGFIKYIENLLKMEIQSVLLGNPRGDSLPAVFILMSFSLRLKAS